MLKLGSLESKALSFALEDRDRIYELSAMMCLKKYQKEMHKFGYGGGKRYLSLGSRKNRK
jgi:hypothetical protein